MRQTALITGASRGIGMELARIFAENGHDLILIARNEEDLQQLKNEITSKYAIDIQLIIKDLSLKDAPREVYNEVKSQGKEVDFLVNNAGFGDYGKFSTTDWETHRKMIDLNAMALTEFCHLYLRDWEKRGSGKILNVSSTSAFQPGPMMAVYFATKVFVLYLSEAIGQEMKDKGITVTTLCPGPTDTNFGQVSGMRAKDLVKNVKIADAKEVAQLGYDAMMKGKPVVIHGLQNKLVAFGVRFLPRKWVTDLSYKVLT